MIAEYLLAGVLCLLLVGAFLLGFEAGKRVGLRTVEPLLPVEPVVPDREKQRAYEEELKAFSACMNYSADVAYGEKSLDEE